jgi:hypothetical protein
MGMEMMMSRTMNKAMKKRKIEAGACPRQKQTTSDWYVFLFLVIYGVFLLYLINIFSYIIVAIWL